MENRILRTIGASVVLACLAVAGVAQVSAGRDAEPVQIAVDAPSSTQPPDPGSSAPSNPSSTVPPEPFVYRVGLLDGVSTTNFWAYYGREASVWNTYVLGLTKASLFEVDRASGRLVPDLSASEPPQPTWDSDGWKVSVELAADRAWSDGTPVTAKDFAFTFATVRSLGLGGSWADAFPDTVKSVEPAGDGVVMIRFSERPDIGTWPHGPGVAPAMPAHIWSEVTESVDADGLYALDGIEDVSSGRLVLETVKESLVVSVDNPGDTDESDVDVVEYHVFGDEPALLEALQAGEVDTVLTPKGLTPGQAAMIDSSPDVELMTNPSHGVRYLGFNLTRAPMGDIAFRRAIALLLDRDELAASLTGGTAATSFVAEVDGPWYDADRSSEVTGLYSGTPEDRLAAALEGLRQAGYSWAQPPTWSEGEWVAGTGLTINDVAPQPLTILTPGDAYDPTRPEYVGAIADVLAVLGFDARPVETDFDTVVDLAFTPDQDGSLKYDMYVLGWTLGNQALPEFYRPLFAVDGEVNNTGYASDAFTRALQIYESSHSQDHARAALWDMERILANDLPYLLLYSSHVTEAYRSDRVVFGSKTRIGGIQGDLGALDDVKPADRSTLAG